MDNTFHKPVIAPTETAQTIGKQEKIDTLCTLLIEFIFVMIPLIFIFAAMGFHGHLKDFWSDFEWSFVAAVLFGLTIVKLVSGSMSGKSRPRWQPTVLLLAIVLIGMLLNFILLSMAYSEHLPTRFASAGNIIVNTNNAANAGGGTSSVLPSVSETHSGSWIATTQGVFFVISCLTYFIIGGYGQLRLTRVESSKQSQG